MKYYDIFVIFVFAFIVALVAVAIISHSIKPLAVGLLLSVAMVGISGFTDDSED